MLRHQKLWEGSRVRPSYTALTTSYSPRAALELAAAKIVIYCPGINQTAPSLLPFPHPPPFSYLTPVSTIPQRKTNSDLSYSLNLLRITLVCMHIYTHTLGLLTLCLQWSLQSYTMNICCCIQCCKDPVMQCKYSTTKNGAANTQRQLPEKRSFWCQMEKLI